MAHTFDTGLDKPQRTKIRDAVIVRLAVLKKTANPALYIPEGGIKTLSRPFRGAGDEEMRGELAATFQGQSPAIGVAIGRLAFEERGTSALESGGELDVAVFVASAHKRGMVDGRLYGDAAAAADNTLDPGLFVILEHIRQLLLGQELDIAGVSELRPVEEDEVATFDDLTVWQQLYRAQVDIEINPHRGVAQLLTSIEVQNNLDSIAAGDTGSAGQPLKPLITTIANIPPES